MRCSCPFINKKYKYLFWLAPRRAVSETPRKNSTVITIYGRVLVCNKPRQNKELCVSMRFFYSVDAAKIRTSKRAKSDRSSPTRVSTTQLTLRPTVLKFLITHNYTFILSRTPLYKRSVPRTSQYLHSTQPTHETNIHAPTRIQTHIPRNQAGRIHTP